MTDNARGARFFEKAADRFIFRFAVYLILGIVVATAAFFADLFLDRFRLAMGAQAVADGLLSGLAVLAGLCLFELFLFGSRGRMRQLRTEARRSGTMLNAIVQSIPDLVYIKDADGRHLLVNRAVEEFSGVPERELIGKSMADLLPANLAGPCMRSDREPVVTGKTCRIEERFAVAGGERVLDTIKTPFRDEQGAIIGIVGVSRDITERIRAEEERQRLQQQLLQVQKMEALGHLAGGIAHDFNNMLTVIMAYSGALKRTHAHDETLVTNANGILAASERARALIRSLNAFSSKQKIEVKPVDLNCLLNGCGQMLRQIVHESVAVTMQCCSGPLTVLADQVQLERVLMNLVSNARDAMPDGGSLTLSTATYSMGDDFIQKHGYGEPGDYALITVADSGTGMPEERLKKIFEPFFTTKDPTRGTGLGLAIVYGIVKQHQGFVNVSSVPGRGTTFHVYLPIAKGPLAMAADAVH